jgi:hypothetical protein
MSVDTIRFYEKRGLLPKPAKRRSLSSLWPSRPGNFWGPSATERYFLLLAVQWAENEKTLNTAKTLSLQGVKVVSGRNRIRIET